MRPSDVFPGKGGRTPSPAHRRVPGEEWSDETGPRVTRERTVSSGNRRASERRGGGRNSRTPSPPASTAPERPGGGGLCTQPVPGNSGPRRCVSGPFFRLVSRKSAPLPFRRLIERARRVRPPRPPAQGSGGGCRERVAHRDPHRCGAGGLFGGLRC